MPRFNAMRSLGAIVVALLATAAAAPTAPAGEYRVYSCKTPSGMVAPTDGWSSSRGQSVSSEPSNLCQSGGPLVAELNRSHGQPANTAVVSWGWSAPAGTDIVAYRIWRDAFVLSAGEPAATPFVFSARPENAATGPNVVDYCAAGYGCTSLGGSSPVLSAANLVAEDLRSFGPVANWYINAACGGTTGQFCMPRAGVMSLAQVHAAEFTLRDPEAPSVNNVTGRLTSAGPHSGTELVSFTAADSVSGVYRVLLEINGRLVRAGIVDSNDGRCADAGVDVNTPYEFMYRVPCRKSVRYDFALDTRTITDGTHDVRVLVEDASGNRTSVWSSPEFVVRNGAGSTTPAAGAGGLSGSGTAAETGNGTAGAANGTAGTAVRACAGVASGLSASFTRNDASRLTLRHRQAFGIRGRGPANTDIDVFHIRGSKVTPLGSFRTSPTGSYSERFRARHGGGQIQLCGPGMTKTLTLRVKAAVSFKVRISNWGLVRYSGRVGTGQIPKGGKIVAIQGKAGPSWQTFALRRTDSKGRFKGRYRLRVVRPGAKLRFRVRVPSEAGYPFVGVVSKSVVKRVR